MAGDSHLRLTSRRPPPLLLHGPVVNSSATLPSPLSRPCPLFVFADRQLCVCQASISGYLNRLTTSLWIKIFTRQTTFNPPTTPGSSQMGLKSLSAFWSKTILLSYWQPSRNWMEVLWFWHGWNWSYTFFTSHPFLFNNRHTALRMKIPGHSSKLSCSPWSNRAVQMGAERVDASRSAAVMDGGGGRGRGIGSCFHVRDQKMIFPPT